MKIRYALLTAVTGLALSGAVPTDALAQSRYGDRDYNDRGYTREYRGGRDSRAEQVVRQAYRDILRREPDRSGLRQYTDAMVRRDWSENDVRRALRQSDEYRDRFGRSRGRRSYR